MPKLLGKLPKYRKHRASGQAIVTLGGRDFYLGPHNTKASKAEYDRLCREYIASGGSSARRPEEHLTISGLLAAFWKHAEKHYAGSSELANFKTLIKRVRKAYGPTAVSEFGPLRLKAFRESLIAANLSRTHVNQSINRVRSIFKWGVENELVEPRILEALRAVAGLRFGKSEAKETEPIRPVPDAHVDTVLPYCSPQVAAMIELQRLTGMRSGEIVQMRTCDLNTSGAVWTYTPATHKTAYRGHQRIVYIGPKAQALLKAWLRTDLQAPLFQPAEAETWRRQQQHKARKTPLSCGNKPGSNRKAKPSRFPGLTFDPQSYGRAIKYAIQRCNKARAKADPPLPEVPHWHPHQLRHNAATLFRREHGLEVARVLLGHKHAAITEIYAEADRDRATLVAGQIG